MRKSRSPSQRRRKRYKSRHRDDDEDDDYASPSPPTSPTRKRKAAVKVTRKDVDDVSAFCHSFAKFDDLFPGAEFAPVELKELRKICIDIRRNDLVEDLAPKSISRRLVDLEKTFAIPRRKNEGRVPIFDRAETEAPSFSSTSKLRQDDRGKEDVKSRLGIRPNEDALSREQLERRRPTTKPWEINPEVVPRSGFYFEHDNRDTFVSRGRARGRGFHRPYQHRHFEERPRRRFHEEDNRRRLFGDVGYRPRRRRPNSPQFQWKHDLFDADQPESQMKVT